MRMAKSGLGIKTANHVVMAEASRTDRDKSPQSKLYFKILKLLCDDIEEAIKQAPENPELGIDISRTCMRFVLKSMPDSAQEAGRSVAVRQCQYLEDALKKVRTPGVYLEEMKNQFGPDLDPRQFSTNNDTFNSTIASQRRIVSKDAKGLNAPIEQTFSYKRLDLLRAIEKSYNNLRDNALGLVCDKARQMGS